MGAPDQNACVVHQDVEPPGLRDDGVDMRVETLEIRDIKDGWAGGLSICCDLCTGGLGRRLGQVIDINSRACRRERTGKGKANAAPRAGHKCNLALKRKTGHLMPPRCGRSPGRCRQR